MASLFKQTSSSFWWVKFVDPSNGKTVRESTKCRIGSPADDRKAREICSKLCAAEFAAPKSNDAERWSIWVRPFLTATYRSGGRTLTSYLGIWRTLELFLSANNIHTPRSLTRDHCFQYLAWRQSIGHSNSPNRHAISKNRIVQELKLLSRLMNEAVLRDYTSRNVCAKLGIKRDAPKEKDALTEWHTRVIYEELDRLDARAANKHERQLYDAFRVSFTIASIQGCRLSETCFPVTAVDFARRRVTLLAKGSRVYSQRLNQALIPYLQSIFSDGRQLSFVMP